MSESSIHAVNSTIKNITFENYVGLHDSLGIGSYALYFGYLYSLYDTKGSFSLSICINPLFKKGVKTLSSTISVHKNNVISNIDSNSIVISINGIFKTHNTMCEKWILIINEVNDTKETLIKSFSGGTVPPSNILWDGKNPFGELVDDGRYSFVLILVDSLEHITYSNKVFLHLF